MTEISSAPTDIKLTRAFTRTPSSWDPQDDLLLRHLKEQQKLGWKEIASHFAHRTPNACQFRWRRLRSGSLKSSGSTATSTPSTASSTPGATTIPIPASTLSSVVSKDSSSSPSLSPPMTPSNTLKSLIPQQVRSNSMTSNSSPKPSNIADINYKKWAFSNPSRQTNSKDEPDPLSRSLSSSSASSDDDNDEQQFLSTRQVPGTKWTSEEDELILTRKERELSFTELSIILSARTEIQIQSRISELEKRSKSTSAISSDSPHNTPIKHVRHSHPHPLHSSSSNPITIEATNQKLMRSYSNSSQASVASSSSFLNSDSARSKSFSHQSPYPLVLTERYSSRKNSISMSPSHHIAVNQTGKKPRSNSMRYSTSMSSVVGPSGSLGSLRSLRTGSFSYYNSELTSDDEDTASSIHFNISNIRGEPIKNTIPPLGSLFNDYFAK